MNYLVHLSLSDPDPLARLGNLAGDFVKGRIAGDWPPRFAFGLAQHRRVDLFAHHSADFNRSRLRLDPCFGRYRGIAIDIFYDHLLATHWDDYHAEPLDRFAADIYAELCRHQDILPPAFQRVAQRMAEHDWLTSYRERDVVALVLRRMAQHGGHPLLAESAGELDRHLPGLTADFAAFMAAARDWRAREGS